MQKNLVSSESILILLAVLLIGVGCTDSVLNTPNNQPYTSDNFLTGSVSLTDEFGNPVEDRSDVIVVVTNGTTTYSDTTDSSGVWILYDVPAGVYQISAHAESEGYTGLPVGAIARRDNIQYVGTGGYTVQAFRLARDISPLMISNASLELKWIYRHDGHDTTVATDSLAIINVNFSTRNVGVWGYEVIVVDAIGSTCGSAVAIDGEQTTSDAMGKVNLALNIYNTLRDKYKTQLSATQLFLQIRPAFSRRPSTEIEPLPVCLSPISLPLQL
ncbi:MAG: hypothetical protein HQ472_10240 [Ignavibacteria bacterium]|nr:hypothetical protein [Ignavibacteria bacterium]